MPDLTPRPCAHCGVPFVPKAHHFARCCSLRCSKLRWHHAQKNLAERAERPCGVCGEPMLVPHPNRVFCSQTCANVNRQVVGHGLTLDEYKALLASQGGVCAVCGGDESWERHQHYRDGFHIDHDHVTGKVRGILCPPCNLMLGYARDNPSVLASAIAYLNR